MGCKAIIGTVLLALPAVAHADITAVYGAPNAPQPFMTLEIAANGDVHGTMLGGKTTFIVHAGHSFVIQKMPDDSLVVSRVEDVGTVMAERMAKLAPEMREQVAKHASEMAIVANGTQTINGRTGDAFFMKLPDGKTSDQPWAVISHDPQLAPLGTAMAGQFEMSMKLMQSVIPPAAFQPMLDVLHKGAPVLMAGMTLQSVTDTPIPASEFVLPAAPQTLDQVRARMANGGMKAGG